MVLRCLLICLLLNCCTPKDVLRTSGNVITAPIQTRASKNIFRDESISYNIKSALLNHGYKYWVMVNSMVCEGRVLLTGNIESNKQREQVTKSIWEVPGVCEVVDHMEIGSQSTVLSYMSDGMLHLKTYLCLTESHDIKWRNLQYSIKEGKIYLMGVVQTPYEARNALDQVSKINGVRHVTSYIRVANIDPNPSPYKAMEYKYLSSAK